MKAVVNANALRDALGNMVAERASTLEIFKHAVISAGDGIVTLKTTDLQQTLSINLEAEVASPGSCTSEVALMRAAVKGLDGLVTLQLKKKSSMEMVQKDGASSRSFRFESLSPDDMPVHSIEDAEPLDVDTSLLREAIRSVAYCSAKNDVRPFLNGVTLTGDCAFGSDGHRMARAPIGREVPDILIPRESIDALLISMSEDDAECYTLKSEDCSTALMVRSSTSTYLTRLIDFRPYDFSRSIPDIDNAPYVVVDPSELRAPLGRVASLSPGAVEISVRQDKMTISGGKNAEFVDHVNCNLVGDEFIVAVNPKYLIELLSCGDTQLVWHCFHSEKAQHFAFDESDVLHIIMPLRR